MCPGPGGKNSLEDRALACVTYASPTHFLASVFPSVQSRYQSRYPPGSLPTLGSTKPCTWLPLVRLVLFPEELWGGEALSWPLCVSCDCCVGLVPVGSLQLCSWISGNSGLGCLSGKGTACLHSERKLKHVQWKRTGRGSEGNSQPGPSSRCRGQEQHWGMGQNLSSGQVSRTEAQEGPAPTNSRWGRTELLALGRPG